MDSQKIEKTISSAKLSFQNKDYHSAISGFQAAISFFKQTGDELNAAEMANNLSVAYLQLGKKEKALEAVAGTDLIFEKHNDKNRQATALGNYGAALEALKKYDKAGQAYQNSADLFEQAGEKELRSFVLKSLAALQIKQGKQLDSIFSMQKSLSVKENRSIKERFLDFLLKLPFRFLSK